MMMEKLGKVTVNMNAKGLPADLERYKARAVELGASRVTIVKVDEIPVDEKVVLKCQIPRCFGYGTSVHIPPNTLKPAELREILKGYRWAVLFTLDVPPEIIVRDRATIKEREAAYRKIFEIVGEIESMAFYDGHYLAFGVGPDHGTRSAASMKPAKQRKVSGAGYLSARVLPWKRWASMFTSWPRLKGWDIYPIGSNAKPGEIHKGTLAGIVIVQ